MTLRPYWSGDKEGFSLTITYQSSQAEQDPQKALKAIKDAESLLLSLLNKVYMVFVVPTCAYAWWAHTSMRHTPSIHYK